MDNDSATALKVQVMRYLVLVPTIILYYDHILTFAQEVEWIWKRKLTLPTALFLILRYSVTFWEVLFLSVLFNASFSSKLSCTFMVKVPMAYFVLHTAVIETILTLRTYALYRCNRVVLIVLSAYIVTQFISTFILTLRAQSDRLSNRPGPETMVRPTATVNLPDCPTNFRSDTITLFWWFSIGFDSLVFVLTFFKLNRLRKKISPDKFPLLKVITRDGLIFYVVICFFNFLNVWCYFFLEPETKVASINFSFSFSTTMIARLVLNIQDVSRQSVGRFSAANSLNQDGEGSSSWETGDDDGVLTTIPSLSVFFNHAQAQAQARAQAGAAGDTVTSRPLKRSVWNSIEDLHRTSTGPSAP